MAKGTRSKRFTPLQRRWLSALLRIGGSVLALLLLFYFLPVAEVWRTLRFLPPQLWIFVIAGYLASHVVAINKWRLMVNLAGAGLTLPQSVRCYFSGLFSTLFLPSIVGGDVVRAAVAFRLGKSKAAIVMGGLIDRTLDFTALALLAGLGAALVPIALPARTRHVFLITAVVVAVLVAAVTPAIVCFPARKLSFRFRRSIVRLRFAARAMRRKPHYVASALCLGLIVQVSFIWLTAHLAERGDLRLPFQAWLMAWPLAKLSGLIPVTQGGIGVREAALVIFLVPFGAPPAKTMAVGLAWEAVIIVGGIIAGFVAAFLSRSSSQENAGALSSEAASERSCPPQS